MKAYPSDDSSKACHLTAFMGFKAGMTHIVREVNKPGSKVHKKDIVEQCTVVECPEMIAIGVVGYIDTPKGKRGITTVWADHLSEEVQRRFYKTWHKSKKNAFTKYMKLTEEDKETAKEIALLKKHCMAIRVIAHSQPSKTAVNQKRAHLMEIQVNGGDVAAKVDFAMSLLSRPIPISSIFRDNEMLDTISINKGHGREGVIKRWGVTRLPRKTHRGLRKVACIGAWHPARVQFQIARGGQMGYHHRVEINKKVYRVGRGSDVNNAATDCDVTEKSITPMGGFPHYGTVKNDFLLIKGCVSGSRKRPITLRKSMRPLTTRMAIEEIQLKFIDTASKVGHGKFQTSNEKAAWFGPRKVKKTITKE